jgi:predicted MPP superfamily phosphohydrolase
MALRRFLPDLLVLVAALGAGFASLRHHPDRLRRWLWRPSAFVLSAGLAATAAQAAGWSWGFRALLISGLAFLWGACLLWALAAAWALRRAPVSPSRRQLLAATAAALPPLAAAGGYFIGRRQFRLVETDLRIPQLAPDLDGLRLAQLSDIHLSPFLSRADLAWCVAMANETRPHLALVTGDLVTGLHDSIEDCLLELARLHPSSGIFGCLGNHESYLRAEEFTTRAAARLGIEFLRSHRRTLAFGAARLNLAGVDHQWDPGRYLAGTASLLEPGALNLLLSHHPAVFPEAARQGWDLTLSGHMHGGQINLELARANLNFMRLVTPYVYGVYHRGRSALYVTRGIGTVGVPVRLGAPPEVALLRLRRA